MALLAPLAWLALGMTVPLSGTVEDAAGRPVAGATVWLGDTVANRAGPEVLATAETDERGRFRLDRADDLTGRGGIWSPTLWAFRPGSRVAFVEFKRNLPAADEPVRLVLGPPASAPLRVVRADGKAVAGARLRPVEFTFKAPRPPDTMLDRLAATTDADGRATLDGVAPADLFAIDVTVPGQIVQCLAADPETATITLRPLGRLKVRVVADDPRAARGWTITARSRPTESGYRGPYTTHWVREKTDADGRIDFPPLAAGQVLWEITEGSNYLAEKSPAVAIRAGEVNEVEIAVRRGIRVEGVVREEPGGAPIAGVKVDLHPLNIGSRSFEWLVTDAQGRFSDVVLPGKIRFNFGLHDMPKDHFLPPGVPHWLDFDVKDAEERHDFVPPPLRKAARVRGRVLDASGKPAAGVSVEGAWTSAEYGRNPNTARVQTDALGEFALGSIAPRAEVRVSASSGPVAASEPVTVPSAGEGEPVTLRLKTRPTLALAGRVLGPDARPLAGASVRVKIRPPGQGFQPGTDFAFDAPGAVLTGPDGRYRTPDQIPVGNDYKVEAQAPGYEPAGSRWVVPPDLSVPDLTLRRAVGTRALAGRVVGSGGKAVAGAEVFASGDGPRRARVLTDANGRFRVSGVPDAPALLFVSKEGHHFLGRRVEPGDRPVEILLPRLDEPPAAPLRPAAPAVPRAEERAIARALIAEARKAPGSAHDVPDRRHLPEITAMVDPDLAVERIENQVDPATPELLAALAVGRFEADPTTALDVLDAVSQPAPASAAALSLFDRLRAAAPPDFRRELLERAARHARAIDDSGQAAGQLARVADRWLDLGDADRGSTLVREAQGRAAKPRTQSFPEPRDDLALALARVDLPAALKLLEGTQPSYPLDTVRAGIAKRVAATDPAAARRVIAAIEENRRPPARTAAALRMAAHDLPAARALAAEGHDPVAEALLPAIAARTRLASEPEAARALLRESVERLAKLADGPEVRTSPALALARLLPLAARIDPDRAPDVFWRALACRPPLSPPDGRVPVTPQVRQHALDLAELAALAARYDRATAEVVFAPVAARLADLYDEHWGLGGEGPAIFRAAGAFDARVARAMLDALPEELPPPPNRNVISPATFRHHTRDLARLALARALGLPPALRLGEPLTPGRNDDWLQALED